MIPQEVVDLAELIFPGLADLSDEECDKVIRVAWRIWEAGYRKADQPGPTP